LKKNKEKEIKFKQHIINILKRNSLATDEECKKLEELL